MDGTHNKVRRKESMGKGEDRISYLPDPILQSILTMMPLKSAIQTDVLSKKWRKFWQYSLSLATTLEFGEDFSNKLSAKDFVDTVNRYLSLNNREKLEKFHVFFCPFDLFAPDIERWVSFAAVRGVRNLDIDLSQGFRNLEDGEFSDERSPFELPSSLYECDSLTDLRISRCDFSTPLNLRNFGGLQSLSVSYATIDEDMLQSILTECSLLESLALRSCQQLGVISITGPDLRLKRLTIGDCWSTNLVEINAPKLQSFHYFGRLCSENTFLNISSLEDASIYSIGRTLEHDNMYVEMLTDLSHVQILTLCTATLMNMTQNEQDDADVFPIELQNLKELQLLVTSITHEYLKCIYSFFYLTSSPFLEKLFIHVSSCPAKIEDPSGTNYDLTGLVSTVEPIELSNLKVIKLTNFKGSRNEMALVGFLLQKANVLETMVLVPPPAEKRNGQKRLILIILKGQILMLPKASPCADIILHEFGEDQGLNPTHVEIYNDNSCFPAIHCMVTESNF